MTIKYKFQIPNKSVYKLKIYVKINSKANFKRIPLKMLEKKEKIEIVDIKITN
jgi:hypothetical protein